jgi:hypothetical protein
MNKFAFAAVTALALTAATSAFAGEVVQTGHGAAVMTHADQGSAPAGNLTGQEFTVNYGGPGTVDLLPGTAVVSTGSTQLIRNNDANPSQSVVSLGLGRYIIG